MSNNLFKGIQATIDTNKRIPTRAKSTLERLKEDLQTIDARKQKLIDCVNKIENLEFEVGDSVIHPEYGKSMIFDIEIEESEELYLDRMPMKGYSETLESGVYVFIRVPGYMDGFWVTVESILPYNEASKVLYGKK